MTLVTHVIIISNFFLFWVSKNRGVALKKYVIIYVCYIS